MRKTDYRPSKKWWLAGIATALVGFVGIYALDNTPLPAAIRSAKGARKPVNKSQPAPAATATAATLAGINFVKALQPHYTACPERLRVTLHPNVAHGYVPPMLANTLDWFDRHLKKY